MTERNNSALLKRILNTELTSLKAECAQLSNDVRELVSLCESDMKTMCDALLVSCKKVDNERDEAVRLYRTEEARRRDYLNQLHALKGNIRVVCRIRPVNKTDEEKGSREVAVHRISREKVRCDGKDFEFDEVFGPKHSNVHVFDEALPMIESVFEGYHACIFAYGQTGSGKTFTMSGIPSDRGVNYRAVERLFDMREAMMSGGQYSSIKFYVSNVEVYNETIRDLLSKNEAVELQIRQDLQNGVHVPGCTRLVTDSAKSVFETMEYGQRNRAQALTKMNSESSRSHSVFMVEVEIVENHESGRVIQGKLILVDLAGSERLSKSGVSGERQKEARCINSSLSALGDVIAALGAKSNHVPFRNSKLTFLLQDSMSKQNKVMMIVQTAPTQYNVQESLCTLGFGARARAVELGRAEVRVGFGGAASAESSSLAAQRTQASQAQSKQQVELMKQKMQLEQKVLALERALEQAETKAQRAEKMVAEKEEHAQKLEEERNEAVSKVSAMASMSSLHANGTKPINNNSSISSTSDATKPKVAALAVRSENVAVGNESAMTKRQIERQKAAAQVKARQMEKERQVREARLQVKNTPSVLQGEGGASDKEKTNSPMVWNQIAGKIEAQRMGFSVKDSQALSPVPKHQSIGGPKRSLLGAPSSISDQSRSFAASFSSSTSLYGENASPPNVRTNKVGLLGSVRSSSAFSSIRSTPSFVAQHQQPTSVLDTSTDSTGLPLPPPLSCSKPSLLSRPFAGSSTSVVPPGSAARPSLLPFANLSSSTRSSFRHHVEEIPSRRLQPSFMSQGISLGQGPSRIAERTISGGQVPASQQRRLLQ